MVEKREWVALFSQSGREIVELSRELGSSPSVIISNNVDDTTYHPELQDLKDSVMFVAKHDQLMNLMRDHHRNFKTLPIITLHGYLRLIPDDICEMFEIYNGHPGLINVYPELRGKDPQEKVISNLGKYPTIGSVVHRCTPDLDGGKIVSTWATQTPKDGADVYELLRNCSLNAWVNFFTLKGIQFK